MTRYEKIPAELISLDQWVCARGDSKVPMQAEVNEAASSTDPATWSDFLTAIKAIKLEHYDYLGFVFNDNGIVGIDIDCGYDEDGFISPLAADIIGKCKSYTEKSKSGRGFHILVKGELPFKGKNNLAGVEIYKVARYFILTGDAMLYEEMIENQEAIDYVVSTYFKESEKESKPKGNHERIYNPVWGKAKTENGKIKLKPSYPPILQGKRNISLLSLAGSLHSQGYNKSQIYKELLHVNDTACEPPLGENEIQNICNSVARYKRK